jgi:anti-anti-sigma regulatory factor
MTLKFDTKETYMLIFPENSILDANMTEELTEGVEQQVNNGMNNFIVDLSNCQKYEITANEPLLELHNKVYNDMNGSIVFTNLTGEVFVKIKQERLHLSLNITPTQLEAVDIISMEVLERDILGE